MNKQILRAAPLLCALLLALSGCGSKNTDPESAALARGFNQGAASSQISAQSARVISVKPDVVYIFNGRAEKLVPGMTVPGGAIIRADETGSARLSMADGAELSISPETEISLAEAGSLSAGKSGDGGIARKLDGMFGGRSSAPADAAIGIRGLK